MVKVLSQAGMSLADVYDVEGSIAGVEQLESKEIQLVHEMGHTIFSERFQTGFLRVTTGALLQSVNFNAVSTGITLAPGRLLGVLVFSDDESRIAQCAVMVRTATAPARDFPVWIWDTTSFLATRFEDEGAGVASLEVLLPAPQSVQLPTFCGGADQRTMSSDIALRGATTAFGAGDVTITAVYYIAEAQLGGISSTGLPIPSW